MATTWRHFNRNIFLHETWQQETAWPTDHRSEVVRERPIRTQINTQPVRSLAVQLSHLSSRNSRNSSAKISDSPFFRVSNSGYSSGTPRAFHGTTCRQVLSSRNVEIGVDTLPTVSIETLGYTVSVYGDGWITLTPSRKDGVYCFIPWRKRRLGYRVKLL